MEFRLYIKSGINSEIISHTKRDGAASRCQGHPKPCLKVVPFPYFYTKTILNLDKYDK